MVVLALWVGAKILGIAPSWGRQAPAAREPDPRAEIEATATLQWARVQLVEHVGPAPDDAPPPAEVFAQVSRRYRECRTFEDRGQEWTLQGGQVSEARFTLAFERPDRFRLGVRQFARFGPPEWWSNVVWRRGADVRTRSHFGPEPQVAQEVSLASALATPLLGSLPSKVPGLLLAVAPGKAFLGYIKDPRHDCMVRINGRACYCIRGTWWLKDTPIAVWVDAEAFLIRRTEESCTLESGTPMRCITLYHPRVDVPIAPARLEFDVPE